MHLTSEARRCHLSGEPEQVAREAARETLDRRERRFDVPDARRRSEAGESSSGRNPGERSETREGAKRLSAPGIGHAGHPVLVGPGAWRGLGRSETVGAGDDERLSVVEQHGGQRGLGLGGLACARLEGVEVNGGATNPAFAG